MIRIHKVCEVEDQLQAREHKAKTSSSPYKTVDEAADYLRLQPQTLNNMRTARRGPGYHKHGRRIVYHVDELDRWSQQGRVDIGEVQGEFVF